MGGDWGVDGFKFLVFYGVECFVIEYVCWVGMEYVGVGY